jgi:hypothetical protein
LTSPANGATYTAPASIAMSATASDPDDSVSQVDFYNGTTLLGTDSTSPYSFTWSNVPAGSYGLVAVARDSRGATTVSSTRTVTVTATQIPGRAVFAPSSNHSTAVTRYVLEIFTAGSDPGTDSPVATQDLGKPAVVNGECQADVSQTIAGLSPGNYFATVTAEGPGGSARSAPSAMFTR